MKRFVQTLLIAAATCGGIAAASTLDTVKQRGSLSCGGNGQVPGFGLPDTPFVRHGDDQWFDIVTWVHFAMINAEDFNITRANVDEQLKTQYGPGLAAEDHSWTQCVVE